MAEVVTPLEDVYREMQAIDTDLFDLNSSPDLRLLAATADRRELLSLRERARKTHPLWSIMSEQDSNI